MGNYPNGVDLPTYLSTLSPEEKREELERIMEQAEPERIELGEGDTAFLTRNVSVHKTRDGLKLYTVEDEKPSTN